MGILKLPKSFFTKERDNAYSDWETAIWRELIQNSRDAQATEIRISLDTNDEGETVLLCQDNGVGMTREILESVYFSLGESSKDLGDTVGGFGRARILIPFSFDHYEIESSDFLVTGANAEYEIHGDRDFVSGFRITAYTRELTPQTSAKALASYVRECHLPGIEIFLTVDGEETLLQQDQPLGDPIRSLHRWGNTNNPPFGKVYYDVDGTKETLIRVKGLSMMSVYSNQPKGRLVVEVSPSPEEPIFSSSRDSLLYPERNEVTKFQNELVSEGESALRPKYVHERRSFSGRGVLLAETRKKVIGTKGLEVRQQKKPEAALNSRVLEVFKSDHNDPDREYEYVVDESKGPERRQKLYAVSEFIQDVPILIQTSSSELLAAVDQYDPVNWTFVMKGDKPVWKNCLYQLHLLLSWQEAVKSALIALNSDPTTELDQDLAYLVGFIFSDWSEAYTDEEPIRTFYLSPVKGEKRRFDLRKRAAAQAICGVACHEVAHVSCSLHNEDYAKALTTITSHFPWENTIKTILSIKF